MNALRLGIVGFGRLAREYYVPALPTVDGARLVAVADPLPASRAAAARLAGVTVFDDHRAMLERAALDGLLVASPPSTHLAVWEDGARRGLAVFMEKPFVLSDDLDRLPRPATAPRLMLDLNRRFWPPYRRIGELVAAGALGTPVAIDYRLHTDPDVWSAVTRHRFVSGEGGVLHDLGSLAIDLALQLMGSEPERVAADARTVRWAGDHVQLRLEFRDGSSVSCDLAYDRPPCERLVARGPAGGVLLADPNMALHHLRNGARRGLLGGCADAVAFGYRALRPARRMARASIRDALDAFVRAGRGTSPFAPGFEDAVRNARLIAVAARAARERRAVATPP